jgi:hypothetical protein
MKKFYNLTVGLCLSIGLWSCGESSTDNATTAEGTKATSQHIDSAAEGANTCLLSYQTKYDQLLSDSDVLSATGFTKENLDIKYNQTLKNPVYHEYIFKFKNGRKGKVMGSDMVLPMPDMVVVRSIEPMSLKRFINSYRAVTAEEMQHAQKAMDDVLEGKTDNDKINDQVAKAEQLGVDKKDIKAVGNTMTNAFQEVTKGYQSVEGLGDAACWNTRTKELFVLSKGVKFEIRTDISEEDEANKKLAITLAQKVLQKCP